MTIVETLTRREGETYDDFVARVALNPDAARVKLADIADNLDPDRGTVPRLVERYERAREALKTASE